MQVIKFCKAPKESKLLWTLMLSLLFRQSVAHFIQIDNNEFRASGYPRPHLPPPLPPMDQFFHHMPAKELTPAELMVDLSNDLTYRILHFHSILNRNNFAFSPTALVSVLVALYEGAAGRSAIELRNVLQLPNNRDVIRVGYRDIHRRLRTYFFGSDNPLKGLSLNKENVTISRDYETVLMFYGYDLGSDMVSSSTIPKVLENSTTTTTPTATPDTTTVSTETSTNENQTTPQEKETVEVVTSSAPTTTTTSIDMPNTIDEASNITTTEVSITDAEVTTTTINTEEIKTTEANTETTETTTNPSPAETENTAAEFISAFVAEDVGEPSLRIQKAQVVKLPNAKLVAPPQPVIPKTKYLPTARSATTSNRATAKTNKRQKRQKRHLLSLKELEANLFVTLFNPQPQHHNLIPVAEHPASIAVDNEFDVHVEPHFIPATSAKQQNYNTDVISHVFYLGNQHIVHTTFKVYNAVLYYKYFESLKMSVLELELDTPEYNLMILLPDYNTDLVSAAASLRLAPSLRLMRKQLKPRWVQAIIPDFKLHGTMFLTNDLQNLGICEIFEPNRADFRSMTDEKGIYVKHIEQSINVNIRTHPINQLKRNYGMQTQPIQISVNHPFLFFVIDRDLEVAVMSGRILNPLNVRIQ